MQERSIPTRLTEVTLLDSEHTPHTLLTIHTLFSIPSTFALVSVRQLESYSPPVIVQNRLQGCSHGPSRYVPGNTIQTIHAIMGIFANSLGSASVSSRSGSGAAPSSLVPPASTLEPRLRTHKKGKSSVTSVTFVGESYWGSKAPKLVSLEVASRTPRIIKRGFEYMYHKSYRLTGASFSFGPVSSFVRKSQRDAPPHGTAPTHIDPDGMLSPLPVAHDSTAAVDVYSDSTKQILKAAPLISLEEAKRREASRNRAVKRMPGKGIQVEHEVRRLKREVAEIAWKKAQARRDEESPVYPKSSREKECFEDPEKRKREEEPMLTAAVAAREDGLVVAPTNWIVPLISLDEARHTEKAKRDAADKSKLPLPPLRPPASAAVSVDSLVINAGNRNTTTLRLISLEEAAKRDRARRLEEEAIRSRNRMLAHAGTGLSHVPLITLVEARKQDALQRKQDWDGTESSTSISKSRRPNHPPQSPSTNQAIETGNGGRGGRSRAAVVHEKARWLALMSNAGNWWTLSTAASRRSDPASTPTSLANRV